MALFLFCRYITLERQNVKISESEIQKDQGEFSIISVCMCDTYITCVRNTYLDIHTYIYNPLVLLLSCIKFTAWNPRVGSFLFFWKLKLIWTQQNNNLWLPSRMRLWKLHETVFYCIFQPIYRYLTEANCFSGILLLIYTYESKLKY